MDFVSSSTSHTLRFGRRLGELAQPGDVIGLIGELGSGKTTLVKGIAEGLGIKELVTSPTFIILCPYPGRLTLYHIDCYRISSGEEAMEAGIEECLYGEGISVIEWAERIADILPEERLEIHLKFVAANKRGLAFFPFGDRYDRLVRAFRESAFGY